MAQPTLPDIAEAVAKQIPGFFNDAFEQFRQGEGGYIANGEPEGVIAQIGQGVARSFCRQYGAGEYSPSSRDAERIESACRPYLNTLDPGDGLKIQQPFTGGQCPVTYQFQIETFQPNGTSNGFQTITCGANFRGPLSLETRSIPNGEEVYLLGFTLGGLPRENRVISGQQGVSARLLNIQRCTAGQDNCGDPPPVIVSPRINPDPTPPPFRFNPGPLVDIPINVDFNPDGTIGFDFGGDTTTVDPFPDDDPGAPGDGGGGAPGDPTDPGTPGGSGDTGLGGDQEGEAGEDEELVGVLVEVLQSPQNPNVFANNASQVFRGIGYVRMGYPNRLGTDISGGTVISPQFFHAQQRGLTNWAVSANTGFNLRTTPYYRSIEVNV